MTFGHQLETWVLVFQGFLGGMGFFVCLFINRRQHKPHPKLQKLPENNAAACYAFPTMLN